MFLSRVMALIDWSRRKLLLVPELVSCHGTFLSHNSNNLETILRMM